MLVLEGDDDVTLLAYCLEYGLLSPGLRLLHSVSWYQVQDLPCC